MTHQLLTLALAPVLLLQGKSVRRSTPKLPEPPGAREGEKGQGATLRLLIIGDSAAAGVGAEHQDDALLGQLIKLLSASFRVCWQLEAITGATTSSTLQRLKQQGQQDFDIVITSLGVNDVTSTISPKNWQRQQAIFRRVIVEKYQPSLIIISGLPPMGAFPALPNPLRWYLGRRAKLFNHILRQELIHSDKIKLLIKEGIPDTSGMASDGFHPGPPFYREWADNLAHVIRQKFT